MESVENFQGNLDFDGSGTVPPFVARTTRRPDIVMYSKLTKRVVIIELTNGCEENFQGWHEKKRRSYSKDLIPDMKKNGWKVDFFPVEVGARGYCSSSVRKCFLNLGFPKKILKDALLKIGRTSLECSFHIWLCRETAQWEIEDEPPWKEFRNTCLLRVKNQSDSKTKDAPDKPNQGRKVRPKADRKALGQNKLKRRESAIEESASEKVKKTRQGKARKGQSVGKPKDARERLDQLRKDHGKADRKSLSQDKLKRKVSAIDESAIGKVKKTWQGRSKRDAAEKEKDYRRVVFKYPKHVPKSANWHKRNILSEEKKLQPRGLANRGSTCYLNSLLQALTCVSTCWLPFVQHLSSVPSLVNKLLTTLMAMKSSNEGRPCDKDWPPVLDSAKLQGVDTLPLLSALEEAKQQGGDGNFRWKDANDVSEVLITLISETEKCLGPWSTLSACPREVTTCGNCGHESLEETNSAMVNLEPRKHLSQSLEEYMRKKSGPSASCLECDVIATRSQRMLMYSSPEVLLIQLNRWTSNPKKPAELIKSNVVVDVSSESLVLPVKSGDAAEFFTYRLKAVICHVGGAGSGHYMTYAKHSGSWYLFNDNKVRLLKKTEVECSICTKHAYMFVFEK